MRPFLPIMTPITMLAGGMLVGTPLVHRPSVAGPQPRAAPLRVLAVSAPPKLTDFDRAEEARLKGTDAFAELVNLNQPKQAVNRPQKVHLHRMICPPTPLCVKLCTIVLVFGPDCYVAALLYTNSCN